MHLHVFCRIPASLVNMHRITFQVLISAKTAGMHKRCCLSPCNPQTEETPRILLNQGDLTCYKHYGITTKMRRGEREFGESFTELSWLLQLVRNLPDRKGQGRAGQNRWLRVGKGKEGKYREGEECSRKN